MVRKDPRSTNPRRYALPNTCPKPGTKRDINAATKGGTKLGRRSSWVVVFDEFMSYLLAYIFKTAF
jgi:hypothetical protein